MGIRFYRGIRLGKLARLNVSKSGVGLSLGVRGLRVSTGPRGTFLTLGLPGTGLSYRKKVGTSGGIAWPDFKGLFGHRDEAEEKPAKLVAAAETVPTPTKPDHEMTPTEQQFVAGVKNYKQGQTKAALDIFLSLSREEVGAAVMAAAILAQTEANIATATRMLERVLQADDEHDFPTPLMQEYLDDTEIKIEVTPSVAVSAPINMISLSLLLVELYQDQNRLDEAVGLLEELDDILEEKIPVITLSLSELYAVADLWDGIIERANYVQESEDDVTLEIMLFYGRALQEKDLHDAAITIFTKALRRTKDRSAALLNEARYWRASSYDKSGNHRRADEEYQKLFAEAPDFRDVAEKVGLA